MAQNQIARQQIPPSRNTQRPQRSSTQTPTTQESSRLREARSNRQRKNHAPKMRVNPIVQLVQRHPILIWSTLWAAMLGAGSLAILGLANPGYVEKVDSLPETTTTPNTVLQEQNNAERPAWMYGAIAIGCAIGGWVVIKQLKGSRRRRLLRKPLKQRPASQPSPPPQKQKPPTQRQKAAAPTRPQASNRRKSGKPSLPKQALPASESKLTVETSQFPYSDESETRLADSIDLRKRQPLSSLLKNK